MCPEAWSLSPKFCLNKYQLCQERIMQFYRCEPVSCHCIGGTMLLPYLSSKSANDEAKTLSSGKLAWRPLILNIVAKIGPAFRGSPLSNLNTSQCAHQQRPLSFLFTLSVTRKFQIVHQARGWLFHSSPFLLYLAPSFKALGPAAIELQPLL